MTTALAVHDAVAIAACRASIAAHSRSFALASRLLSPVARDHASIVYAWCRAADDAVDLVVGPDQLRAISDLHRDVDAIYRGSPTSVTSRAFSSVVRARSIPETYPRALVDGMAMDATDTRYATFHELFVYCYRVAGVVGLTMSHVLGVRADTALVQAAHLGIAMQLTNVCRDVAEDWDRGRLYLPDDILARHGAAGLADELGKPMPLSAVTAVRATVLDLLRVADRYYASGHNGLSALPWRAGFGIAAAGRIYRAIGTGLRRRGGDALSGRVVVGRAAKLGHVAVAAGYALAQAPAILSARWFGRDPRLPARLVELNDVPLL